MYTQFLSRFNDALCVRSTAISYVFYASWTLWFIVADISFDISISRIKFVEKMSALSIFYFSEINKECYLFHNLFLFHKINF